MNIERERKFLLPGDAVLGGKGEFLFAGYHTCTIDSAYFTETGPAVRVTRRRNCTDPEMKEVSKVCIKLGSGLERLEFEYTIPTDDAKLLLSSAPTFLSKRRYFVRGFEIDHIFIPGDNGLWIAEYEENPEKPPYRELGHVFPQLRHAMEVTDNDACSMRALAWHHGRRESKPVDTGTVPMQLFLNLKDRLDEVGKTGASFLSTLRDNTDELHTDEATQQISEKEATFEAVLNNAGYKVP